MSVEETPRTIAELQARMKEGWQALSAALARFDESEMTAVDPSSGWSIKDHLSHLAGWEAGIVAVLHGGNRAAAMGISDEEWRNLKMDQMNEVIYERNKSLSLAEVRAHFEKVHMDMVSAVAEMTDEDLRRSYVTFQPDETGDSADRPIIGWLVGDTYEHFNEHLRYLDERFASGTG